MPRGLRGDCILFASWPNEFNEISCLVPYEFFIEMVKKYKKVIPVGTVEVDHYISIMREDMLLALESFNSFSLLNLERTEKAKVILKKIIDDSFYTVLEVWADYPLVSPSWGFSPDYRELYE